MCVMVYHFFEFVTSYIPVIETFPTSCPRAMIKGFNTVPNSCKPADYSFIELSPLLYFYFMWIRIWNRNVEKFIIQFAPLLPVNQFLLLEVVALSVKGHLDVQFVYTFLMQCYNR